MREPTSLSATDVIASPPPATEGLGPLDQDRALSLADEGGVSAAGLESQEPGPDWHRGNGLGPNPGSAESSRRTAAPSRG
jgi:hypothetical protein